MKPKTSVTYQLENFEGPIELLLQLIKREELTIEQISISSLAKQCLEGIRENFSYEEATEFLFYASTLLYWKSQKLLPKEEEEVLELPDEEEESSLLLHHIVEYCQFKEVAKELTTLEEEAQGFYIRSAPPLPDFPKKLGIEHLTLSDLASLFQSVLDKAVATPGKIQEEIYRVSDQVNLIRALFQTHQKIVFDDLFHPSLAKERLIVTFLAILELMKLGEVKVGKEVDSNQIVFVKP